jgi:hypothetical protein
MTKAFNPVNERLVRLYKEGAIPMPDFSILKYATILIPKLIGSRFRVHGSKVTTV